LGQSRLVEVKARIDATSFERISVELAYVVDVAEVDGGSSDGPSDRVEAGIPLEGLAFRPAELKSVTASVGNGDPTPVSLESSRIGRLSGAVPLPPGTTGRVELLIKYDVRSGVEGDDPYRIRIPVLAVAWPSAEALPGIFTAEALLANDLKVYETFPSGITRQGAAGPVGRFVVDLPAIPALISMRATTGPVPLGGLVRILDGLVLLALAATVWVGFRYLGRTK